MRCSQEGDVGRCASESKGWVCSCLFQLYWALIVESVLAVFNDGGNRFEHVAVPILYRFLQVEILDRNMIVAEAEFAANEIEIGFFHGLARCLLVGKIALRRDHSRVDQHCGVVSLSP